jgi:hypothetical protein
MSTWRPATFDEVIAVVERELAECEPVARAFFEARRVEPRQACIRRFEEDEFVVVVAEAKGVALYYEDVEEGWNLSPLSPEGRILEPGWEQDHLAWALNKWRSR